MIFSFDKFGTWWRNRHSRREDRQWARRRTRKVFAWLPVRIAYPGASERFFCEHNTMTWKWVWLQPVYKVWVWKTSMYYKNTYVWIAIHKLRRA